MKQIKVSDVVAEKLDKRRGKHQLTYSEAIESYFKESSLLYFLKGFLSKVNDKL